MNKSAVISECGTYRYRLTREWSVAQKIGWIMLNPSTADADRDDPTITAITDFSKRWGCGQLVVGNLYAFRATDPLELRKTFDPVGPENDAALHAIFTECRLVICAWGVQRPILHRARDVLCMMKNHPNLLTYALRITKDGHPSHPLYIARSTPLVRYPA